MQMISHHIGKTKNYTYQQKEYRSAIGKQPVPKLELTTEKIIGDEITDTKHHGGADRALCFYPYEHYAMWKKEFNREISIPAFGENITVAGMLEKDVCIGDIYEIGHAVVQISQGRIPCATISKYNKEDLFLKKVIDSCFTGYFARVLKEGTITLDSQIVLKERHPLEVDVLFANQVFFHRSHERRALERVLAVKELAPVMRENFMNKWKKSHPYESSI